MFVLVVMSGGKVDGFSGRRGAGGSGKIGFELKGGKSKEKTKALHSIRPNRDSTPSPTRWVPAAVQEGHGSLEQC